MEIGGESASLKAFHTAGFLGTEHGPFLITDPQDAASAVRPPAELGEARFTSRRELYETAARAGAGLPVRRRLPARVAAAIARCGRSAADVAVGEGVRPVARAEAQLRHLQHRPLRPGLPAGAPSGRGGRALRRGHHRNTFRSVYWDTHENGHERATAMKKLIDAPVAQLILDLEERGLLDRTLVVLASEFGRDAITEGKVGKEVKDQATTCRT